MKAYITLLSTNEYLDGVLALHQSLIEVGSKYPLVVAITSNIDPFVRNIFKQKKIETIELQDFSYHKDCEKKFLNIGMPHWFNTAAKIKIFGLTDFEKLIYLDSDMMVLKNIDHLFLKEDGSAVEDSPMLYEENVETHYQLNSGLLVIVPSKEKELKLIELAKTHLVADQDLIRLLYSNWINCPALHLPIEYNIFNSRISNYIQCGIKVEDFYVIHFIGKIKPFMSLNKKNIPKDFSQYFENMYLSLLERSQSGLIYGQEFDF